MNRALILSALAAAALALPASSVTFDQGHVATLRALDKITGRSTDFKIEVGEPVLYGSLMIDMKVCYGTPPEEAPENAAFLSISTTQALLASSMSQPQRLSDIERKSEAMDNDEKVFSGWMYSSSPGLNALEHPVYDVWVINCTADAPVIPDEPAPTEPPAE